MATKRHRMTPKRKAALRKAQAASARKRRSGRNRRLAIAGGVTVLAVTAGAAYLGHRYTRSVVSGGPKTRLSKSKELDVVRITALHSGKAGQPARVRIRGSGYPGASTDIHIRAFDRIAKERAKKHPRELKKRFGQRRKYWQGKPVPRSNRFTRQEAARRRKK